LLIQTYDSSTDRCSATSLAVTSLDERRPTALEVRDLVRPEVVVETPPTTSRSSRSARFEVGHHPSSGHYDSPELIVGDIRAFFGAQR